MPVKRTQEQAIAELKQVHGERYGFEKFHYLNAAKMVTLTCEKHGDFNVRYHACLKGSGCLKCSHEAARLKDPIERLIKVHGDTYNYTHVDYQGTKKQITIECKVHGKFQQKYEKHVAGQGCPKCKLGKIALKQTRTQEEAIKELQQGRGDFYGYQKVEYKGCYEKIEIICPDHGPFWQSYNAHLRGQNCPSCGSRRAVSNHQSVLNRLKTKQGCLLERAGLVPDRRYKPDLYFPDKNLAVDFHGAYWHSERHQTTTGTRDKIQAFRQQGVKILTFFWGQCFDNAHLNIIRHHLGETNRRIYARKCELVQGDFRDFYGNNHLLGKPRSGNGWGLTYQGELVAAGTFKRWQGNGWNMTRFANAPDTQVVGGFGKILKAFRKVNQERLVTFSDNLISDGGLYRRLGFEQEAELRPDYWYQRNNEVLHNKRKFRHSKLAKMQDFDYNPEETEHQNCLRNGYRRVYDAGKIRWVL